MNYIPDQYNPQGRSNYKSSKTEGIFGHLKWIKIKKLKVYHFIIISVIIILLPIFKEWNMLLNGERVTGVSVGERLFDIGKGPTMRKNEQRTGIAYYLDDKEFIGHAPDNLTIPVGKEIPLILSPKDQSNFLIATVPGFYLKFDRAVILVIVLIIWGAIFATLYELQKN